MVDIRRHETVIIETDEIYFARTFDEALKELSKVHAAVQCDSFALDKDAIQHPCEMCSMYATNNVRRMATEGMKGEKCEIRLALNALATVRNIAKTGKP